MENGDRDFAKAIRGIIATYGKTTLNDIRRVNALLMDLAPGQARKRKLIVTALEEGIGTDLIRGVAQKETERILCFNRCVKHLMAEAWVTEEAARFAVYTIAEAVEFEVSVPPAIRAEEAGAVEKEWGKENRPGSVDISKALCGYSVIGYKAFAANVDLTEVHIPPGVKKIKPKAFIDCVNLRRIALPASIEEVGSDVFAGCDALEIVDIEKNSNYGIVAGLVIDKKRKAVIRATGKIDPVCVIPGEIEAIRPRAFERSKVQEITIPRSLGAFDAEAVRLCSQLRQFNIERNHIIFSTIEGVLHIHYNADVLGPISALGAGKNSIVEKSASDTKSIRQGLAILADYYRKVEAKLGTLTLFDYNKQQKPENRLPIRILIVNRAENPRWSLDDADMAYVVNNAKKFGITAIFLNRSEDGGSKGKEREKKHLPGGENRIRVISDTGGHFFVENDVGWLPFRWLDAPDSLPLDFISRVAAATKPREIGSKYFSRYRMPPLSSAFYRNAAVREKSAGNKRP